MALVLTGLGLQVWGCRLYFLGSGGTGLGFKGFRALGYGPGRLAISGAVISSADSILFVRFGGACGCSWIIPT